jgi:hypothetical protein
VCCTEMRVGGRQEEEIYDGLLSEEEGRGCTGI